MAGRASSPRKAVALAVGAPPDPAGELERARVAMLTHRDRLASTAVQLAKAARGRAGQRLVALRDAVRAYELACGEYDRAFARLYGEHLALRVHAPADL